MNEPVGVNEDKITSSSAETMKLMALTGFPPTDTARYVAKPQATLPGNEAAFPLRHTYFNPGVSELFFVKMKPDHGP